MAPPRSLAAAALVATAAAVVLSSNLELFPRLIVTYAHQTPSSPRLLPHRRRTCPAGLLYSRKCGRLAARVRELEAALAAAAEKAASERRGRVRAQQVRSPTCRAASCRAFRLCTHFLFDSSHAADC
jgi:hypothetical protein